MAIDAQAKKFLGSLWADAGNRSTPESVGIDRTEGWDINYEQPGTGKFPERAVFNQLVRELQGAFQEHIWYGIPRWDAGVSYPQYAFVQVDGVIYVSTQAHSSPSPRPDSSDMWRLY